jgi:Zn-dependent protease with chaperone function
MGLDNAYYDHWKDRIVLGEVLIQRLESQERMALVAHELTHVKKGHLVKEVLILPFIAIVITLLLLHREPDSVFCAVCIALFLVLFPYISRRFEYEADAGAAHETSPTATISLLKKTEVEERWGYESVTHPSIRAGLVELRSYLNVNANYHLLRLSKYLRNSCNRLAFFKQRFRIYL